MCAHAHAHASMHACMHTHREIHIHTRYMMIGTSRRHGCKDQDLVWLWCMPVSLRRQQSKKEGCFKSEVSIDSTARPRHQTENPGAKGFCCYSNRSEEGGRESPPLCIRRKTLERIDNREKSDLINNGFYLLLKERSWKKQ